MFRSNIINYFLINIIGGAEPEKYNLINVYQKSIIIEQAWAVLVDSNVILDIPPETDNICDK